MLAKLTRLLNRLRGRGPDAALAALAPQDRRLIARVRAQRLTYLSPARLASLCSTCHAIEAAHIPGLFIEAGCALGGSTVLLATTKCDARVLRVYDVFDMIPPPTDADPEEVHERYRTIAAGESQGIGGDKYYGYEENLVARVEANLRAFDIDCDAHSVALIKGLLQDTLHVDAPVAFAHIDVDWYEPVMCCLERIFPSLSVGGSIVLDDYHDWGGCRKAVDEFLQGCAGQFILDDSAGSMKITRTTA